MSTQPKRDYSVDEMDEQAVAAYLRAHPEFFEQHAGLLANLRLPHQPGGAAVSLVERQVAVLRQRNLKLERKLRDLVAVARSNNALAGHIHGLGMQLIETHDLKSILQIVERVLRENFGADQSVLVRMVDSLPSDELLPGRFFRQVARDDPAIKAFGTFVQSGKPRCGQVRDSQRDFLFGADTDEFGSVALVPLGEQCSIGFVAIGSNDAERFHPAMSIDFLNRFGDLVGAALAGV